MRRLLALATLLPLASCGIEQDVPCMAGNEEGTVEQIQRIPYTDTCHETMCKDHEQPDKDILVIRFRMKSGATRVCRGQWYPEAATLIEGAHVTVTRLTRGKL